VSLVCWGKVDLSEQGHRQVCNSGVAGMLLGAYMQFFRNKVDWATSYLLTWTPFQPHNHTNNDDSDTD